MTVPSISSTTAAIAMGAGAVYRSVILPSGAGFDVDFRDSEFLVAGSERHLPGMWFVGIWPSASSQSFQGSGTQIEPRVAEILTGRAGFDIVTPNSILQSRAYQDDQSAYGMMGDQRTRQEREQTFGIVCRELDCDGILSISMGELDSVGGVVPGVRREFVVYLYSNEAQSSIWRLRGEYAYKTGDSMMMGDDSEIRGPLAEAVGERLIQDLMLAGTGSARAPRPDPEEMAASTGASVPMTGVSFEPAGPSAATDLAGIRTLGLWPGDQSQIWTGVGLQVAPFVAELMIDDGHFAVITPNDISQSEIYQDDQAQIAYGGGTDLRTRQEKEEVYARLCAALHCDALLFVNVEAPAGAEIFGSSPKYALSVNLFSRAAGTAVLRLSGQYVPPTPDPTGAYLSAADEKAIAEAIVERLVQQMSQSSTSPAPRPADQQQPDTAPGGEVVVGMSKQRVFEILGEPAKRSVDIEQDPPLEKWQYQINEIEILVVSFEGGTVTRVERF